MPIQVQTSRLPGAELGSENICSDPNTGIEEEYESSLGEGGTVRSVPAQAGADDPEKKRGSPRFGLLHKVICSNGGENYFLDPPRMFRGDRKLDHVRGQMGIDLTTYFDRHCDEVFAVVDIYKCACGQGPTDHQVVGFSDGRLVQDSPTATCTGQAAFLRESLRDTIKDLITLQLDRFGGLSSVETDAWCSKPYYPFYLHNQTSERIDLCLHSTKSIFQNTADDIGKAAMDKDEPPDDDFLAMMPPKIHAFDFTKKSWRLIRVDRITGVTWNKDAFKRLVVPPEIRELIEAAVTVHGHYLTTARDIIDGKGRGLLILLHGGPGTGKTLTAESIAEAQERPLYRVTCGDIGMDPDEAEKATQYLQSVLTIGKAWSCVVLLDEAYVFLEERSLNDQRQNVFVSVFLRALEYYDGILILTTNRVGTFDEAFKSRIHLALLYPNLDEEQRAEIWRNFIRMLSRTKELVDTEDLEQNVYKLAQIDINGRQIRNILTLARYLAKFRKQVLVYNHVRDAVASVMRFNKYLETVRSSDDSWARESRLR
ncbi:P-loop containing nucleoside triphosphate hydrolase protein [Rhypophila decipiens]